jgi:hypothetical protein
MGWTMGEDSVDMHALIEQAVAGDQRAAGDLFARFEDRLLRMVRLPGF